MELRQVFSRDVLSDHQLVALLGYCLREVKPFRETVRYEGEYIDLKEYEILLSFSDLERELNIPQDRIIEKLNDLEKLRRVKLSRTQKYAKVELNSFQYPINPPQGVRDLDSGIVSIPFAQWKEIDFQNVQRRHSPKYLELVQIALNGFENAVGDKRLDTLTKVDYRNYIEWLGNRSVRSKKGNGSLSPISINNYTRALKASIRRAVADGYLKDDPFNGIRPIHVDPKDPIFFEKEELEQFFFLVPHDWLRQAFMFIVLTGMRREEVNKLSWKAIDRENNLISIKEREDFRPKFGKRRKIPISPAIKEILDHQEKWQREAGIETDYVFVDESGRRLSKDRLTKECKKAIRAGGLRETLNVHALRRTFATTLVQNGISLNTVKGLLGHSSVRTTELYVGTPTDAMSSALDGVNIKSFLPRPGGGLA